MHHKHHKSHSLDKYTQNYLHGGMWKMFFLTLKQKTSSARDKTVAFLLVWLVKTNVATFTFLAGNRLLLIEKQSDCISCNLVHHYESPKWVFERWWKPNLKKCEINESPALVFERGSFGSPPSIKPLMDKGRSVSTLLSVYPQLWTQTTFVSLKY